MTAIKIAVITSVFALSGCSHSAKVEPAYIASNTYDSMSCEALHVEWQKVYKLAGSAHKRRTRNNIESGMAGVAGIALGTYISTKQNDRYADRMTNRLSHLTGSLLVIKETWQRKGC